MTRTDKTGSQQKTPASPFLGLVSTVYRRYETPTQEPTHGINYKMTRSICQIPYFELTCAPKHALPHHMFQGARRLLKSHDWCLEKQKFNAAGQGQFDLSI